MMLKIDWAHVALAGLAVVLAGFTLFLAKDYPAFVPIAGTVTTAALVSLASLLKGSPKMDPADVLEPAPPSPADSPAMSKKKPSN